MAPVTRPFVPSRTGVVASHGASICRGSRDRALDHGHLLGEATHAVGKAWVSEEEQKPPLRPEAPAPVSYCSTTTTRDRDRALWREALSKAGVAAPTTQRSAADVADQRGMLCRLERSASSHTVRVEARRGVVNEESFFSILRPVSDWNHLSWQSLSWRVANERRFSCRPLRRILPLVCLKKVPRTHGKRPATSRIFEPLIGE